MSERRFFSGFSGVAGFTDWPIQPSERHYCPASLGDPGKIGIDQVRIPSVFAKCRLTALCENSTLAELASRSRGSLTRIDGGTRAIGPGDDPPWICRLKW